MEAIGDLKEATLLPAYQTEHEVSALASPILYANRVAGCLLFSSTQRNYFLSPARQALISGYTRLLALAFEPEEFYPMSLIELRLMPPIQVQRELFAEFQQRVYTVVLESYNMQRSLTYQEAEQAAWQQIEEELISLSLNATGDN